MQRHALLLSLFMLGWGFAAPTTGWTQRFDRAAVYVETRWTARDGLPVTRLAEVELLQTRDGYLWIGTRDGLVRFDGVRFTVHTSDNARGLPSNRIAHLLEARDGTLWIATSEGHLVRYARRGFTAVHTIGTAEPDSIFAMAEDDRGRLWVATAHGVARTEGERLIRFLPDRIPDRIRHLTADRYGNLWLATAGNGLVRVDRADGVRRFTTADGLAGNDVARVYEAYDGDLWVEHPGRSTLSRLRQGRFTSACPTGPTPDAGYRLHQDRLGRLWLSADDRLYAYQQAQWLSIPLSDITRRHLAQSDARAWAVAGELLPPVSSQPGKRIVAPNLGSPVLQDREGNRWIASRADGLFRYTPALFRTISDFPTDPNLYALCERRDGSVWTGALDGSINRLGRDGRRTHIGPSYPLRRGAMALFEDRDGNLWAGQALCTRDHPDCAVLEPVPALANTRVRAIAQDRSGVLWFGTEDGLLRLVPGPDPARPHLGTWKRFTRATGLTRNHVQAILEARDGTLWFGTNGGGLVRYRDGVFSALTTDHGLPSNRVRALYEDERGVLWVGTEDLGLVRIALPPAGKTAFDPSLARLTVFRERDGLFDNGLHTILDDGHGRLWMSTNRGIFWVERAALDAFAEGRLAQVPSTAYTGRDGLLDPEANGGSAHAGLRSHDGHLWFATQVGAAVVNPSDVHPNAVPPPVVIEGATTQWESVPIDEERLSLERGHRDFEINYTGISLSAPDRVRFRYRLEGFDHEWVEAGTRRTAAYTNVPPGTYVFRVVAANNDGVWNEQGASIRVVVPPYPHETWWFRSLVLLSVLLGAYALYRARLRRMVERERELVRRVEERTHELREEKEKTEAQARRLLELDEMKSHFFANISHEFRTPLTLIIGPLQQLLSGHEGVLPSAVQQHLAAMLRSSHRLLRLINQILDLSRVESGLLRLRMEPHDIVGFIEGAARVFAPLADVRQIRFTHHIIQPDLPPDRAWTVAFDRDMMEKVVANLLSNAFKFTPPGGAVELRLRAAPGAVEIEVADNGPGIPQDQLPLIFDRFHQVDTGSRREFEGSGLGLSLVKEFVDLHGGTVHVASTLAEGSTFTVRLPAQDLLPTSVHGNGAPAGPGWSLDVSAWLTPPANGADTEAGAADRTTILVVDDNPDLRSFVASIFDDRYRILQAADGQEGFETARQALPDLIIADVMMPRMDGLDLNRALKQDPDLSCVPVVLLTARAETEDQVAGYATDADAYIVKPFVPEVLRAEVNALLRIRHRLRDRLRIIRGESADEPAEGDPSLQTQLRRIILDNLTNPDLDVEYLAARVALSASQLRRRMTDEAGVPPSTFIRQVRLEEAATLLRQRAGNISEVAFAVGFESLSHFTRSFRAQYGVTPSGFAETAAARKTSRQVEAE